MNVSLTKELERFINDRVGSGLYTTASEVVRAALRLLEEHEQLKATRLESLRKDIKKGLADSRAGRVAPLDMAAIKAKARSRLRKRA